MQYIMCAEKSQNFKYVNEYVKLNADIIKGMI